MIRKKNFRKLMQREGSISFEKFCEYVIKKSLDLEEDDGFDDIELKNLN